MGLFFISFKNLGTYSKFFQRSNFISSFQKQNQDMDNKGMPMPAM